MAGFRFPTTCRRRISLPLVVLLFHLLAGGCGSQPVAGDREALLAIRRDWSSSPQLQSWNDPASDLDHCSWLGITCTGGGVVTELALPNLRLASTIPASLCALKNLTRLDLSYNNLTGTFPAAALYACAKLRFLDLSNNQFSGHLPRDIDRLSPEMERLNLSTNSFTGEVPAAVSRLTALKSLLLDNNRFTGAYPAAGISEIAGLEVLTLGDNAFEPAPLPCEFANLTNLTVLWMDGMNLTGEIPEAFSNLTELKMLSLASNKLTGAIPAWVLRHEKLQSIYLFDNSLSGELPRIVTTVNLVELDVSTNKLTGTIPASIGLLRQLRDIRLFNNRFSGDFPAKIWSIPKLITVMIKNNSFTGTLPSKISSKISQIEMGNNMFSGFFPTSAMGLEVFDAENNRLAGKLPYNMSNLANLIELSVHGNRLTGSIPASIKKLQKLSTLNLSSNWISGIIQPGSIGKLSALTTLDLSNNDLTGEIPSDISNLISKLNLSSNQLVGEVPAQLQIAAYGRSYLGNPGLCARAGSALNLPTCRGVSVKVSSRGKIIIFAMVASIVVLVLIGSIIGIAWLLFRRRRERQELEVWKVTAFTDVLLKFSPSEVLTKLVDENMIGSGGSGRVHRLDVATRTRGGHHETRTVAVKRISGSSQQKMMNYESEIKVLESIRHDNIVQLILCMHSEEEKLVVLEYMEHGSLDRWLHHREGAPTTTPLGWPTRLSIAVDAARGLSHMHHHSGSPIVHRDVKSKNILLGRPNYRAKIADFGLSIFLEAPGQSVFVSSVAGTPGYMAPEILRRPKVNEKVDVYSFGILLLELISGMAPDDGDTDLAQWACRVWRQCQDGARFDDAVDEAIQRDDPMYMKQIRRVFVVGLCCTMQNPRKRPSMQEVLQQLITCQQIII